MARRDPFARLKQPIQSPTTDGSPPPRPIDLIPRASKGRKRDWEKKHPARSYWVPKQLHERARVLRGQIVSLGKQLGGQETPYPADEVSQALMEYALAQVAKGNIVLNAQPDPQSTRMRLTWKEAEEGWPQEIPQLKKRPKQESKKVLVISYRWSEDIHKSVLSLSDRYHLARGEVVVFLLERALAAYRAGKLQLEPVPVVVKQELGGRWQP